MNQIFDYHLADIVYIMYTYIICIYTYWYLANITPGFDAPPAGIRWQDSYTSMGVVRRSRKDIPPPPLLAQVFLLFL